MNNESPEMFSSQWYDEFFKRAASSAAHAEFCRKVYGKNLCQHGLMDMAELDFLVSLIKPGAKIVEMGCANGYITEYIHDQTECEILGLDYSKVAIEQAKERTKHKARTLQFKQADLTQEQIPGNEYDYIVLIDSIYFLGDFQETVRKMIGKLASTGRMIITFFEVKEEEDENSSLPGPDHTLLAQVFGKLGAAYQSYDFTENARTHGIKNYRVGEELRESFQREGNQFLYDVRAAENRFFKESAEKERIVRFMYLVNPLGSA